MSEPTGIQRYWVDLGTDANENRGSVEVVLHADHVRVAEAQQRQIDGLLADLGEIEDLVVKAGVKEYDAHGEPKGPTGLVRDVVQQLATAQSETTVVIKELDEVSAERVTLRKMVGPLVKMLTDWTIVPIGCSREEEQRWKMAVKNLREVFSDEQQAQQAREVA